MPILDIFLNHNCVRMVDDYCPLTEKTMIASTMSYGSFEASIEEESYERRDNIRNQCMILAIIGQEK